MADMESVGADMDLKQQRSDARWERGFQKLLACRQPDGSLRVPTSGPECDEGLCRWCRAQRKAHNSGTLSPERAARLEAAGFVWHFDRKLQDWMDKYQELTKFHQKHGHTRVTSTSPGCSRLFRWTDWQRKLCKEGLLEQDRVRLLEALGFQWGEEHSGLALKKEAHEAAWRAHLVDLAAFKERHGHCLVPYNWKENPKLGAWVNVQRVQHKKGRLPAGRVAALEALGFAWDYAAVYQQLKGEDPVLYAEVAALTPGWVPRRRGRPPLRLD